eukprot:3523608-Prymnesium_polylepis.2
MRRRDWPPIHSEEWVSHCSKAKALLDGAHLHQDVRALPVLAARGAALMHAPVAPRRCWRGGARAIGRR